MAGGAYGEGPDPEESAHTTAMLSENTCTAEELQERPHTAIAITQAPSLLQQSDTAAMTLATAPETSEECD